MVGGNVVEVAVVARAFQRVEVVTVVEALQ